VTAGDRIVELYRRPLNRGTLDVASATVELANPLCGDRIRMSVAMLGEVVSEARFSGDACAITTAAASLLTEHARGATPAVLERMTPQDVVALLGATPPAARMRCATLPLDALKNAIAVVDRRRVVRPVVLAAGRATRFHGDKILAMLDGEAIIRHVVRALAPMGSTVLVVAGANADEVRAALSDLPAGVIENPAPQLGMSESLRVAMRAAPDADALLVALGDQPRIDPRVALRLADVWLESPGWALAAPRYRGARGHPVLLSRAVFPEIEAFDGDVGARALFEGDQRRIGYVEIDAEAPRDVDTPADLAGMQDRVPS
jgi:molybdenum cofactor cytidylyltransferase